MKTANQPIVRRTASPAPVVTVPPTASPDVSFISVTYGSGRVVLDCIASIVRSTAESGRAIEFLVVDNAHEDDHGRTHRELELSTAGVRLILPGRNLGFAGGCELGALHARGDVLAFVNPDLVTDGVWLDPLLDGLDQPGVAISAPVLTNRDGTVQEAGSRVLADGSTAPITDESELSDADYASAACWLVRRDDHERFGGFDSAFFPAFYEDVDLALRAQTLGGRLRVVPSARVLHLHGSGTLGGSQTYDTSRQRDLMLQRHPSVRWRQPR